MSAGRLIAATRADGRRAPPGVRAVACGAVDLWLLAEAGRNSRRAAHEGATELWRDGGATPIVDGPIFLCENAARCWAVARAAALSSAVALIDAFGEFIVSLTPPPVADAAQRPFARAAAPSERSGAGYLRRRAAVLAGREADRRRDEAALAAAQARLARAAAARRVALRPVKGGSYDICLLAPCDAGPRLAAALGDRSFEPLRPTASGPWPPYTFAAEALAPVFGEHAA